MPLTSTRRAGWLVTGASAAVAVATVAVTLTATGPARTVALVVALAAAFALAVWRSIRARRDPTTVHGARPISSWIAVFSWAVTLFAALVGLAAPDPGPRAAVAGVLAGCVFVLVGRGVEHLSDRAGDPPAAR